MEPIVRRIYKLPNDELAHFVWRVDDVYVFVGLGGGHYELDPHELTDICDTGTDHIGFNPADGSVEGITGHCIAFNSPLDGELTAWLTPDGPMDPVRVGSVHQWRQATRGNAQGLIRVILSEDSEFHLHPMRERVMLRLLRGASILWAGEFYASDLAEGLLWALSSAARASGS